MPYTPVVALHPIEQMLARLGRDKLWLAGKCGVSTYTIQKIVKGKRSLAPDEFLTKKIQMVLGLDYNELIGLRAMPQSLAHPKS